MKPVFYQNKITSPFYKVSLSFATIFLGILLQGPLFAGDSENLFEIAVTVRADTAGTKKTNANNSPGPDGTQPRNPEGTQA